MLFRLGSKQSPVEELLRQADGLILTQQPKAEVGCEGGVEHLLDKKDVSKIIGHIPC